MNTYTTGITKIFIPQQGILYGDINNLKKMAAKAGYSALSHNGIIYVYDKANKRWCETPFLIMDFSTEGSI